MVLALLAFASTANADPKAKTVVLVEVGTSLQSPDEVERQVTVPIERVLLDLSGVQTVDSTATHGLGRVEIGFELDATESQLASVRQRVDGLPWTNTAGLISLTFRLAEGSLHKIAVHP